MSGTSVFTPPRIAIRRLAVARFTSLVGSSAAFTALGYLVYKRTGDSTTWFAASLFVTFGAEAVFTPLGGALGDVVDRRKLLIASDLLGAIGFVALAIVQAPGWMLGVAFATAVVGAPFYSVATAAVPNLAGDEELSWANGLVSMGSNLGFLIGPVLGGSLIGLLAGGGTARELRTAAWVVFGLNAVSFVASAGLVRSIHGRFSEGSHADAAEGTGLAAGARFLFGDRVLRTIVLAWIVFLVGVGAILVAELPLAESFGAGAIGFGALGSMWAGGAVIGSFAGSRLLTARREPGALILGVAFMGIGLLLIAVAPWFALVLILMGLAGTGEGFGGVAEHSLIQRLTPDHIRSRVMGIGEGAAVGTLALSFLIGGPVVEILGVRGAYVLGGSTGLLATLVLLRVRGEMRDRAGEGEQSGAVDRRPSDPEG